MRARTPDTAKVYFWHDPRQILELASPPDGIGISPAQLRTAAAQALATWSHPAIADTVVSLQLSSENVADELAKRDGHNRIIMRSGAWCRDPAQMLDCHDPTQLALTTWFVRSHPGQPDDGQILEADTEVNTIDHSFAIIPSGPVAARDYLDDYDLASVLTHEAGHFIGLAHNCRGPEDQLLLDDQGNLSPECSSAAAQLPAIYDGTMYPSMDSVDVRQRSLTSDDVRAVCEMYPPGSLPDDPWKGELSCSISGAASQRDGGRPGSGSLWRLMVGLMVVATLRWRPSRAERRSRSFCCSPGNIAERLKNLKTLRSSTDEFH